MPRASRTSRIAKKSGLGVQRVEDGLDEQNVHAAVQQSANLFAVGPDQFIKGRSASGRVADVGADGRGFGRRPDGTGHEADAARLCRHERVRRAPGAFGAGLGQLVRQGFQAVIGEGDGLGIKGVGLDDVGPGLQVFAVDVLDDCRLSDIEQVVVAFEVLALPVLEPIPAEIGFAQLALLDHGPHGAIQDDDPLAQHALQVTGSVHGNVHVCSCQQPRTEAARETLQTNNPLHKHKINIS